MCNFLTYILYNDILMCTMMSQGGAYSAILRVWTYWVPLNTQSIRHIPIIVYDMIHNGGYIYEHIIALHHTYSSYTLTVSIGILPFKLRCSTHLNVRIIIACGITYFIIRSVRVGVVRFVVVRDQWQSISEAEPRYYFIWRFERPTISFEKTRSIVNPFNRIGHTMEIIVYFYACSRDSFIIRV